jgi:hypothetical protein
MAPLYYDLFEAVSQADIGIIIATDKPEVLRQRLYAPLKEFGLDCTIHVIDGAVWLVHKTFADMS